MVEKVLKFFNELSNYPRQSGNEEAVANYLVSFAKKRNFYVYKDNYNNVLIKKENIKKEPIILHSHTDMVCVCEPDYEIDFLTTPIKTIIEGDYLSAYKTSLGADNGIGVAIILSLLDENNDYNIEALFTSDEEVTMTGAINFDYSLLNSNKLISLDGMNETELINGCASICDMKIKFKPKFKDIKQLGYCLKVKGLKGGHSGSDINLNLGNSNNILIDILSKLNNIKLCNIKGGNQFNFIANYSKAYFLSSDFEQKFEGIKKQLNSEFPTLELTYEKVEINKVLSIKDSKTLINLLKNIKTGVIVGDNKNIVLSQNLSSINLEEGLIKISQRGHSEVEDEKNIEKLKSLAESNGYDFEIFDKQKGFCTDENSELTKDLVEIYSTLFNKNLNVLNKHISLEAAIFKQKTPNMEIAIISPKILGAHSTKERVFIPSINTTFSLLQKFLSKY